MSFSKHLKNIYATGELLEKDGKTYKTRFYNLDAIIAVGYRINSYQATQFRILTSKGKVSALEAKLKAEGEYEAYRVGQDAEFVSDFDRAVEETKRLQGEVVPLAKRKSGDGLSAGRARTIRRGRARRRGAGRT